MECREESTEQERAGPEEAQAGPRIWDVGEAESGTWEDQVGSSCDHHLRKREWHLRLRDDSGTERRQQLGVTAWGRTLRTWQCVHGGRKRPSVSTVLEFPCLGITPPLVCLLLGLVLETWLSD